MADDGLAEFEVDLGKADDVGLEIIERGKSVE